MGQARVRRTTATCVAFAVVVAMWIVVGVAGVDAQEGNPPGIGIRLLEAPAALADDPRAQNYVIDHVQAGTTIERDFEVGNGDPEDFDVRLYAVGAEITDSAFVPVEGDGQNDLASWTSVEPTSLTVPAGQRVTSTLRIDVPEDAVDGERYAVVFAERQSADQGGLQLLQRVGVRIYLSIGDGPAPVPDFEITSFTARRDESGAPGLQATIENTGARALDLTGDVVLRDGPGGISAGPFDVELGTTLAPGRSTNVDVLLDPDLPNGPWEGTLTVRSGLLEKQAVETILFPEAGAGPNVIEVQPPARNGLDIGAGIIGGGALGLPLLLLWRRRRRTRAGEPGEGVPTGDSSTETVLPGASTARAIGATPSLPGPPVHDRPVPTPAEPPTRSGSAAAATPPPPPGPRPSKPAATVPPPSRN